MPSSLVGHHHHPGLSGGSRFTLHARYHDTLVREDGVWLICAMRQEILFLDGSAAIIAGAA